ncbi:16S rRNA (cytosine(1402)-N(4))-methyltransferase RsmH [Catenovulum sp. SM1970]|uniref:16S rRNA (cytosine(1402)-N(4))-methyltransferase RsmH n=1 Tax=Marinifaba aquimaris TaxID=2741323 RepID=UPI0015718477|nr:16S rRNA (cytosine(1402)-N(4))-methyltransferase RsmH [Marinifaba aquimaris]NTS76595.1 16S rRNA (cytosine(1402)-N(4))-methyltransferase RsmH [Marinifaba aquimaris]
MVDKIQAQVEQSKSHISVLLHESIDALAINPDGVYVDGTFGRGGHSGEILKQLSANGKLIAFDQDPTAIAHASSLTQFADDPRFEIIHSNFANLAACIEARGLIGKIDGVLLDLGVSSPQLDDAERGFSFLRDGPLDMRMNPEQGQSAAEWLAKTDEDEINRVLKEYGEEKWARAIARAIVKDRVEKPFLRTNDLASLIERIIKKKEPGKHPATRSFQAIRIAVNDELGVITQALEAALAVLAPKGRLSVISFHSLEDRIVKRFINKESKAKPVPRGLPVTDDELSKDIKLKAIGKAQKPSKEEIELNPRSRSSVLRVAERLA